MKTRGWLLCLGILAWTLATGCKPPPPPPEPSAEPAPERKDLQVESAVSANRIGLDDTLELTVTIRGDALGRAGSPKLPKLEGFRVAGQSQSTNLQFVNGQMSSTRSILYQLLPRAEGKHVIGAISVAYGGKEYLTEPIEVEVVSGSVLPGAGRRGGGANPFGADPFDISPFRRKERRPVPQGEVFVTSELSRPEAYVGEQVILTYKLYTQVPIMGLQVDQQPSMTGFWVEEVELPKEPQWKETTVEGKSFYVVEVRKAILFPTKAGRVAIEPAIFSMAVRGGASDPFDSFFSPVTETIRRSTKPLSLEVKPLPTAGSPAEFSGAVGRFELKADLDKSQTSAGDPLTLSVRLQGQGNLRTVEPPALPPLPGFRTYDPKTEETLGAGSAGFGGEKKWQYVLIPDSAGRHRIGPFRFSYFDPERERYVSLEAGPLNLDVAPAAVIAGGGSAGSRGEVRLLRRDIRYLKPAPEELGAHRSPFYRTLLFYASLALPIVWNLGLVAHRWKRQTDAAQEGVLRARRARKIAQGRLKQAHKRARGASKDFYEETSGALYRYVADKLGVSPSGLTTQGIDAMLEERRVPEALRSELIQTIGVCEFGRFTPGERSGEEMEALLVRAEKAIVSLEKHFE